MKKIAIILQSPPHGTSSGREALDCALALSDLHDISFFFTGASLFHLLKQQDPSQILSRNYIKTFSMLELYDIENVYYSLNDLKEYKLPTIEAFSFSIIGLTNEQIAQKWHDQDLILTF